MMAVAAAIGAFSGVAGVYASFYLNVASGAAVVLVATLIFMLVFLFAPGRGSGLAPGVRGQRYGRPG